MRVGGFGGPEGLAAYLRAEGVATVIDATHPFAERMSWSAAAGLRADGHAAAAPRAPGVRARSGDRLARGRARSTTAAARLPQAGRRVFLTTGRQGLAAFAAVRDAFFLVRCVEAPDPAALPPDHELLLDRGPFTSTASSP